jgi:uncharacterized protein (DUF924 family)
VIEGYHTVGRVPLCPYSEALSIQSPSGPLATPEEVLSFWFGRPATSEAELMTRMHRWFRGGAELDEEVARHFGPTVEAALRHDLDGWASTARGRLALVLLLDQMTRSLYRDDPRAYTGDAHAQALSVEAFDCGTHRELGFVERMFLAMPMVHAEDFALQERVAQLATELAAGAPPEYRVVGAMALEQTAKYFGVIRRFGRFPHRNTILGRTSTPEEVEFLKTWAEMQPPMAMRPAS